MFIENHFTLYGNISKSLSGLTIISSLVSLPILCSLLLLAQTSLPVKIPYIPIHTTDSCKKNSSQVYLPHVLSEMWSKVFGFEARQT